MDRKHEKYERLLQRARTFPPVPTAVAHPCDEASLTGAVDAAKMGLIAPILVGPASRIESVAAKCGLKISGLEVLDTPHSHASASKAVDLIRVSRMAILSKIIQGRPSAAPKAPGRL